MLLRSGSRNSLGCQRLLDAGSDDCGMSRHDSWLSSDELLKGILVLGNSIPASRLRSLNTATLVIKAVGFERFKAMDVFKVSSAGP